MCYSNDAEAGLTIASGRRSVTPSTDRIGGDCGARECLQERLDPRQSAIACGLLRFRPSGRPFPYRCRLALTQQEYPQLTKGCNPSYLVHFQTVLTYRSTFRDTFLYPAEAVTDPQREGTIRGLQILYASLIQSLRIAISTC